ncbi:MAG: double-strand break repair protein AddB [Rhizobiaceae bacterium]
MSRTARRVFTIPPGAPFLETLADALLDGRIVPGFPVAGDPLATSRATIYLPTRRAARALRSVLVDRADGAAAILPTIRALGEVDEDGAIFETGASDGIAIPPPIPAVDRLLLLAPLVQRWRSRLPAHIAGLYGEPVVVPASAADAIWLARDLAGLMDEIETEESDWTRLAELVPGDLAAWWQVTLEFLRIVTTHWPDALAARGRANPAAHRSAMIRAEASRLAARPPDGPVIAAGSTGSIPATAELLSVIAGLPDGAVVLPGFDPAIDERTWTALHAEPLPPPTLGHPQYGLAKLVGRLEVERLEVVPLGTPPPPLALRARLVAEALAPAETTDAWPERRRAYGDAAVASALADVAMIEAAGERDEALAVATALRAAVERPGAAAALVTGDRLLARRVRAELERFGIRADDSGGTPLLGTPPGELLTLLVAAVFGPGDPVPAVALLKHPLLRLGMPRADARHAAEAIELVALRGGVGRPDVAGLAARFEDCLAAMRSAPRKPFWLARIDALRETAARRFLAALDSALTPLAALRDGRDVDVATMLQATIAAFEALGRDADGSLAELYRGEAGDRLTDVLRGLMAAEAGLVFDADEWPGVLDALLATETVKPRAGAENRVHIWGALEARLQTVDTLVIGGINEGVWPRRADTDPFLSRSMKTGLSLEPPERRTGLAAHDFVMAMGAPRVILSRAGRSDGAPTVASRWLQRLDAFAGEQAASAMRNRGRRYLDWARALDGHDEAPRFKRPQPSPPIAARPKDFSITEIETLRRDPYAVYARRVLRLEAVEPLVADPSAADRGALFHDILHRFVAGGADPHAADAAERLVEAGRQAFAEAGLPADVEAVWWPRFLSLAPNLIAWEHDQRRDVVARLAEVRAGQTPVGATGATLRGYADRIDLLPAGHADILDYKTGATPSKMQAHTLLAPQLALEAALLRRGAFAPLGPLQPSKLAHVRLKPNGEVFEESILETRSGIKSAPELGEEAWTRLERLLHHYNGPDAGYRSRALPFRAGEVGDYDHLARVAEWSAGGGDDEEGDP